LYNKFSDDFVKKAGLKYFSAIIILTSQII